MALVYCSSISMHHHSSKNGIRFVVTRDGSSLSRWLSKVQPKHETNRPFSNTTVRRFLAGNAPRRRTLIPLDRLRSPFQNNIFFMDHQYCRFQMRRCLSSSSVVEVGDEEQVEAHFRSGPSLRLGTGRLANQTHAAVIGTAGSTVVLATVARDDIHSSSSFSGGDNDQNQYQESVLTVEFKQKAAGVGEIPMGRLRNDPLRMSSEETLACRAIDRSLRPLMRTRDYRDGKPYHFHVHCTVQAVDLWGSTSGHPISTTLNAAAAALGNDALTEPVAATTIAVLSNGNYVQDPGPEIRMSDECIGELLYAGTRSKAIMIEWTSVQRPLPESQWGILLELAAASIQPYLDTIEEMWEIQLQKLTEKINEVDDLIQIRQSLGLDESSSLDSEDATERLMKSREEYQKQQEKLAGAIEYCQERLASPLQRLFGGHTRKIVRDDILDRAYLHKTPEDMPTKSFRGRREQVMQEEIYRLVQNYLDSIEPKTETSNGETNQKQESTGETTDIENEATNKEQERNWICQQTLYRLLNRALWEVSVEQGVRSDNRRGAKLGQGWKTIRPVNATVPALPMAVHGSALFTRGDTQVLCTVTLGAPRDGKPRSDPYQPTNNPREIPEAEKREANGEGTPYESLPVGSLRFLRTQEALESDLNSRKSKADKERTGDSGSLAEFKRAFLQYEFPSYSTGELPAKGGKQRRSIGHGALAERAILPVLPDQADFPYAIRITSEVTDSNGSSSMASVCGATLALLDAGVPLKAPVAAVSVGIAIKNDSDDSDLMKDDYSLLLDITGTEDHYGGMDFKIAGTAGGVTAVQLDVKKPLPLKVLTEALFLAKHGRLAILARLEGITKERFGGLRPRPEPKESAPRVEVVRFDPERKRDLVGPGGIVLRQLEDRYGVSLDLTQEGQCLLFGANREMVKKAKATVMDLVAEIVEGEIYTGTVIEIKDFGAIIELLRNKEGLLHVSELSPADDPYRNHPEGTLGFVKSHLKVGDEIEVLCIGVDPVQGSVKLSRRAILERKKLQH